MGKTLDAYRRLFEGLKKRPLFPLYFLHGPEEYLKKEFIRELIDAALPDGERAFSLDILYGDEFEPALFDDRVGSFGLFSQRRVVVLRNFRALSTAHKDHVIAGVEQLSESVLLVIETEEEKLDTARTKKLAATARRVGLAFPFAHLNERETIERVTGRIRREGREIDSDALDLLVESVGTRLIDIGNETEKILLAAPEGRPIDRELVASVVGRYRTENLFSLLDLLSKQSPAETLGRLSTLIDSGEEPVFVLTMLLRRVVLLLEVRGIIDAHAGRLRSGSDLATHMTSPTSPYYAESLKRQAEQMTTARLHMLLRNFRWADRKLKSTPIPSKTIIQEALLASHVRHTLAEEVA